MTEKQQRRGRAIAMTSDEIDAFLLHERTCRVATVLADGHPHVAPLWFVWDGRSLWLNSLTRSQRWTNLQRDPRVSIVIDAGQDYTELRGVEIRGTAHPDPDAPAHLYARKYLDSDTFTPDDRHAWLRIDPIKITSWDFRKMASTSSAT